MPHIPRRAPTLGIPPEVRPPKDHASIPVSPKTSEPSRPKLRVGLEKINLHTYEPDWKHILETMLGKEPDVNPATGGLVPAKPADNTTAAFGHNGQTLSSHAIFPVLGRLADPHAHRPPS